MCHICITDAQLARQVTVIQIRSRHIRDYSGCHFSLETTPNSIVSRLFRKQWMSVANGKLPMTTSQFSTRAIMVADLQTWSHAAIVASRSSRFVRDKGIVTNSTAFVPGGVLWAKQKHALA